MEWTNHKFTISDQPDSLDLDFIVASLNTTYWAAGRPAKIVKQSLQNAICFGIYDGQRQIGFARVVTDYCTFSWICDVFIDPEYRGQGLGTWMMHCVVNHPEIKNTHQLLGTKDAHDLYERVGFTRREMMSNRPSRPNSA